MDLKHLREAEKICNLCILWFFQGWIFIGRAFRHNIKTYRSEKILVYVPKKYVAKLIGKQGKNIESIEKKLGIGIDVRIGAGVAVRTGVGFGVAVGFGSGVSVGTGV